MSECKAEEHTCETCIYGEWKRKGWTIDMADDKCGGCCSWNDKWEKWRKPNE